MKAMYASKPPMASETKQKYIERRYDGVESVSDMARINEVTEKEMERYVRMNKPIRILQDLRGNFVTSFEIYEEAIKVLNIYPIERVAIVQPADKFVKALAGNTMKIYQRFINYRMFTDVEQAKVWLNSV